MGLGNVRNVVLQSTMRWAENNATTPNGKTLIPLGTPHPLLPKNFLLEDDKAVQAFESYLNKATSETTYKDYFFWRSPRQTRSVDDAKRAIANFFIPIWPTYEVDCYYPDGQNMICDEVHVLSAALVYAKGSELDAKNYDGGGISVSDVKTASHVRWGL